ncbi:hypothetical protein M408DRAFT_18182 [Serendipita vermifera MAFF 305830]|uniref:Peptidase S8/S53 domain-containing protein n=1 Tax=Serendipita vermifera MAFF 305830 TaxID=933852 RepID=A0A0C3AQS6_SERVB|nr:hypothetical protein M408DRAFT_18182 [Serendipita vermifera MAFF 305830]
MFTSLITLLLAASAAQSAPLASTPPTLAPLYRRSGTNNTRYIVSIRANTVDPANRLNWLNGFLPTAKVSAKSVGTSDDGVVHHWDTNIFNGLAGCFDDASLEAIRAQSEVAYIEEDVIMHKSVSAPLQQTNAPWGLSRLSSATPLAVGRTFDPKNTTFDYTFPSSAGAGVDVYIVDSGVHVAHSDFGNRATFLASFGDGVRGDDKDGHGTHVAGTVGGQFFGVAKKASIFAVKVLDDQGAGPISDIISGLDIVSQRVANQTNAANNANNGSSTTPVQAIEIAPPGGTIIKRATANANNFTLLNQLPNNVNTSTPVDTGAATGPRPAVVNMSLGGSGHSNALDAAVKALVAQGVVMVIAAGNDGVEVGDASPADVQEAITVGAMDVRDNVPSFSNFGQKVDIFAPGAAILSCGITSNTANAVLSGTSMAAPHIAGLSALLLGEDPTLTPAQVKTKIQALAVRGALGDGFKVGTGTQNLLANNGL